MTFTDVLAALQGLGDEEVGLVILSPDGRGPIAAFSGTLDAGAEEADDPRGEAWIFNVDGGRGGFTLRADEFVGARWDGDALVIATQLATYCVEP